MGLVWGFCLGTGVQLQACDRVYRLGGSAMDGYSNRAWNVGCLCCIGEILTKCLCDDYEGLYVVLSVCCFVLSF